MQSRVWTSCVNRKLCEYREICDVSPRRLNVPSVANGFLGSRNIYAPVRATARDSIRRVKEMMNDLASSSMIIAPRQSDVSWQVELCPFLAVESWLMQRMLRCEYANWYINSYMRAIAKWVPVWKFLWMYAWNLLEVRIYSEIFWICAIRYLWLKSLYKH